MTLRQVIKHVFIQQAFVQHVFTQSKISRTPTANPRFIKTRQPVLVHNECDFTLPVRREFRSNQFETALEPLQEEEVRHKRRIPSNESDGSPTRAAQRRKIVYNGNQAEYEKSVMDIARDILEARLAVIKNQVKQMELAREFIRNAQDKQKHDRKKIREQLEELDWAIYFAECKLELITDNRSAIAGRTADDLARERIDDPVEGAYIDLLMEKHLVPHHAQLQFEPNKSMRKLQQPWKVKMDNYYNLVDPDHPDKRWCPILQRYLHAENMKAAHIVPSCLREHNAHQLFGPPDDKCFGHLYDVRNGILMYGPLEKAFDLGRFAIVPANVFNSNNPDSEEDPSSLVAVILDDDLRTIEIYPDVLFNDIDGRPLQFKHPDHRPRMRYLYFAFCMALLRRQRFDCKGWREDWSRVLHKTLWGSPEKGWVRHTSMAAIVRSMGASKELFEVLKSGSLPTTHPEDENTDPRDEQAAQAFRKSVLKKQMALMSRSKKE